MLHRYQVIAILCRNIDDSHKLVSSLQYKLLSSSHYKSHNNWLSNGSFEQSSSGPTAQSRTLADDNLTRGSIRCSFRSEMKGFSLPNTTNDLWLKQTSANSSVLVSVAADRENNSQARDRLSAIQNDLHQPTVQSSIREKNLHENLLYEEINTRNPPISSQLQSKRIIDTPRPSPQASPQASPLLVRKLNSTFGNEEFTPMQALIARSKEAEPEEVKVIMRKKTNPNYLRLAGESN